MYNLYLSKYEPQISETRATPQVKEWLCRKIFSGDFNLSFGYPCSATRETCDLFQVAIQSSKSDEEQETCQENSLSTKKR